MRERKKERERDVPSVILCIRSCTNCWFICWRRLAKYACFCDSDGSGCPDIVCNSSLFLVCNERRTKVFSTIVRLFFGSSGIETVG